MRVKVLVTQTETRAVWLQTEGEKPDLGEKHYVAEGESFKNLAAKAVDLFDGSQEGPKVRTAVNFEIIRGE